LAAVTGGTVTLTNLGENTRQPDYGFLTILERMGAKVTRGALTTVITGNGRLKGGFTIDMQPLSDATLTLAAIAPFANAPITMTGVAHIRHHESDRISAMCAALQALGITVEEHDDGLTVHPGAPKFAAVKTHDDHRMAMSLAVLGAAGAGVELDQPGCVSKTCPGFFDQLAELGITTQNIL
ncbi:MAG: 3-phosphoshikimate 1-carboxyvinyltransferase, partial [Alphaproteobacteria bacterium]|nr:3-phosphoshikimate 1-carboxyvinyltransferase [Alphaproteobacteria bacterium]